MDDPPVACGPGPPSDPPPGNPDGADGEALELALLAHAHNLRQPIARLPREIITLIMALVALDSGRDFRRAVRAAQMLKISSSDTLFWRALCQSHYHDCDDQVSRYGGYHELFCKRPQPRFDGVYVCTSQYYRHAEQQGGSWYQQLMVVTYYRYIRLWPDGRCQTLLTVREPDVVLPFTAEYKRDKLDRGEWRIDRDRNVLALNVEREKYVGHLSFKIQSEGGPLHNKLKWRSLRVRRQNDTDWDDIPLSREGNFYYQRVREESHPDQPSTTH